MTPLAKYGLNSSDNWFGVKISKDINTIIEVNLVKCNEYSKKCRNYDNKMQNTRKDAKKQKWDSVSHH